MKAALLAAVAALAAAPFAAAQDAASWSVSGDTSALVGQEARLVYRATVPPGAKLEADPLASGTTSVAVVQARAEKDGSWTWTVLPLDEGKLAFVARWTLDGKPAAAPPAVLETRAPSVGKDADIEDIKPPFAARRAVWPWLLAAALGALAWEGWRRWKARPRPEGPAAPPVPPLPPDEAAERALAELAASGLWERGEHPAYYLRLTDVLREYLEARWGEPATAMTSVEVARLVKAKDPDLKIAAAARELLGRADLVKFARITPGAGDGARDADVVRAIVRATTPKPPASAPAEVRP